MIRIWRGVTRFFEALTDCTCRPNEYVSCHMEVIGGQGDCFACWRLHRAKEDAS